MMINYILQYIWVGNDKLYLNYIYKIFNLIFNFIQHLKQKYLIQYNFNIFYSLVISMIYKLF